MSASNISHLGCICDGKGYQNASSETSPNIHYAPETKSDWQKSSGRGSPRALKSTSFRRHLILFIYLLILLMAACGVILFHNLDKINATLIGCSR